MFIGHFAPALIAAARPKAAGLGLLFGAAQLVDIGFALLLFPGVEAMRMTDGITAMNPMDLYHMPYTHSLVGAAMWALIFGTLFWLFTKKRGAAIGVGLVILSHWFVDWLVHIPDLTWAGSPPGLGLGLWNHPAIAMPLEIALFGGALAYYAVRTRAPGGKGRLWVLAGICALAQAVDWFGPKQAAYSQAIPAMMLAAYALLILTAGWAGRGRTVA